MPSDQYASYASSIIDMDSQAPLGASFFTSALFVASLEASLFAPLGASLDVYTSLPPLDVNSSYTSLEFYSLEAFNAPLSPLYLYPSFTPLNIHAYSSHHHKDKHSHQTDQHMHTRYRFD